MKPIIDWITHNYIELIGSLLGIAYVLLAIKQNILCWLIGIISCAIYMVVFFVTKLYGDMSLQAFYLVMGFYGWYAWYKQNDSTGKIVITSVSRSVFLWLLFSIVTMTWAFGYILTFTDDPIPYWDGFTNALGLAGTWMTARKYLENWLLWIFANVVCVGIYFYKGLYPTVVFYAIMALLAYRGYLIWQKELNLVKND